MALRPDLLGARSAPVEFSWTPDQTMLYALAVGAGQDDPATDLAFTTENSAGVACPRALPTYAAIVTRSATVDLGDIDRARILHAEHTIRLHAPLPAQGRARVMGTVVGVEDKSGGVLVRTEAEAVDAETAQPLVSTVQTIMVRGEHVAGTTVPTPPSVIPDRAPDEQVTLTTRPNQALLYRLTGDRNPLHSDPSYAARGGFDRPILHGMCTFGITGRILLDVVCDGDPDRMAAMDARFTRPVLPGDTLTVAIWRDGPHAHFRTMRGDDVVLDRGRVETRA